MSARKEIADAIRALELPAGWSVIDADRNIDETRKIVILVSLRRLEPAPNAVGAHRGTFKVYVIDPHEDAEAAEDSLDDAVDTLLFLLDSIGGIRWTSADKLIYQGRRSYEINLESFTERKD